MNRIAMLSFHTCPLAVQEGNETGGMNIYVLELAKQLIKKGLEIDIFTYLHDEHVQKLIALENHLRIIHLPLTKIHIPKKELIEYVPEFTNSFFAFSKEHELTYDLIDSHYYLSGIAGIVIQKKLEKQIPHIITFHTLGLMKNLVARTDEEKEQQRRIDAEFLLVQQANKIIAGSESDKAYLEYLYQCKKEKLEIVYPGVDIHLFRPLEKITAKKHLGIPENKKVLLFVGRIEPIKGIETLLYAMRILFAKYKRTDIQLYILGKTSPYQNELQTLCSKLELTPYVQFIPQKSSQELMYYYNASEIFIQPSLYERFGMAALEAMACGIPVITTDATGIADILKKYPDLVTSTNNPLLLAEKIEYLLSHETVHKEFSQRMRKEAKNFNWESIAEKIVKVILFSIEEEFRR